MKKLFFIILIVFISSLVFAHEYILLAYKYRVQKGDTLEVHLLVADGFNIQMERPFQKALTRKFELISESATYDLAANSVEGKLPVVYKKVDFDGLALIHMERDYARIALSTEKFLEYLKEDHLQNITIHKDSAKKMQRERYSRYLKTLILSGDRKDGQLYKKVLGQTLEIVLLQNPYLLQKGNMIQAQIFFESKPLANKVVTARNRTGNKNTIALTARTDAKGICSFKIVRAGEWFIHLTHMIPCADKADSDWESFWASYSFETGM